MIDYDPSQPLLLPEPVSPLYLLLAHRCRSSRMHPLYHNTFALQHNMNTQPFEYHANAALMLVR